MSEKEEKKNELKFASLSTCGFIVQLVVALN